MRIVDPVMQRALDLLRERMVREAFRQCDAVFLLAISTIPQKQREA